MQKGMKTMLLTLAMAFMLSLNCHAMTPGTNQENETDAKKAFVEKFYAGFEDILDYAYVKKYVTPNLLQLLADSYDFDCEGECLATWLFCYEGGGDAGNLVSRQVKVCDENHFLVAFKYIGYEYEVLLTVIKEGDKYLIDGLQQKKSEYTN